MQDDEDYSGMAAHQVDPTIEVHEIEVGGNGVAPGHMGVEEIMAMVEDHKLTMRQKLSELSEFIGAMVIDGDTEVVKDVRSFLDVLRATVVRKIKTV